MLLVPRSAEAGELLTSYKDGALLVGEVHGARNPEQLALYWVLMTEAGKVLGYSKNAMDEMVRREANLFDDPYVDIIGRTFVPLKSIAKESMRQDEFNVYFKEMVRIVTDWIGCKPRELTQHIYDIIDGDLKRKYGDLLR